MRMIPSLSEPGANVTEQLTDARSTSPGLLQYESVPVTGVIIIGNSDVQVNTAGFIYITNRTQKVVYKYNNN